MLFSLHTRLPSSELSLVYLAWPQSTACTSSCNPFTLVKRIGPLSPDVPEIIDHPLPSASPYPAYP